MEGEHLTIGEVKEAHLFPKLVVVGNVIGVGVSLAKVQDVGMVGESGDDVPLTVLWKVTEGQLPIVLSLLYKVFFCDHSVT